MRGILVIIFFYLGSVVFCQTGNARALTLESALQYALENNPTAITDSLRRGLSDQIKKNWYLWLYQIQKQQIFKEYTGLLEDADRIIDLRYESGDIDLAEKSNLSHSVAEIRLSALVVTNELDITRNLIQQLLFTRSEVIPADSALSLYEIDKYQRLQSIHTESADTTTAEYVSFMKEKTIENLQLELDGLFLRIHYYNIDGLPHAEVLLHTAQAQLKSEEIDYLKYIKLIAAVFQIKTEYLETLNQYNQCAINLENYAY
jgi:hypothetical protein